LKRWILLSLLLFCLPGCTPSGESGVEGRLLIEDQPAAGATLEVYLRDEQDRSTAPFAVATTDDGGDYRLDLPPGRYFLIGRKRTHEGSGSTRIFMASCPGNPVKVRESRLQVPAFSLVEMGRGRSLVPDPATGVEGRVTADGEPVNEAYVYIYTEDATDLMGPSYSEAVRTDEQGFYRVDLPAGRYFVAARKRLDGSRLGEPAPGDLNGIFPHNPVEVIQGSYASLADLPLAPVDLGTRSDRRSTGKFKPTGTALSGRIVDAAGRPAAGIYLFAYSDSRMTGKPSHISEATGDDGRFVLHLSDGGAWFVGARSAFGGPLEPGERVGTYDGRSDHGVDVKRGERLDLGEIQVKEVW
jgi:hypothetical protein